MYRKNFLFLLLLIRFAANLTAQDNSSTRDEYLYYIFVNGQYGFINKTGTIVIPPEYSSTRGCYEGMAIVTKDRKLGYISSSGEIIPPQYYDASQFSEGLAAVRKSSSSGSMSGWAYIDKQGNEVISGKSMRSCSIFSQGLASVTMEVPGHTWLLNGYIDKNGETVIPPRFAYGFPFGEDGTAFVQCHKLMDSDLNDKYMLINRSGEFITGPYDETYGFSEGLAAVKKGDKFGFIDTQGNVVIPFEYNTAYFFSEGLAYFEKENESGFMNRLGKTVINLSEQNWHLISSFDDGMASVSENGDYHLIDKTGKVLFTTSSRITPVSNEPPGNNILRIRIEGRSRIIDRNYNTVIPYMFDKTGPVGENLATFKMWGKWGVINMEQQIVVFPDFEGLGQFSEGRCSFQEGDLFGFIDPEGNKIIPAQFEKVYNFSSGVASVMKNGEWDIIDKNGKSTEEPAANLDFSQWKDTPEYPDGDFTEKTQFNNEGYALVRDKFVVAYMDRDFQYIYHPYKINIEDLDKIDFPHFAVITSAKDYTKEINSPGNDIVSAGEDIIVLKRVPAEAGNSCLITTKTGSRFWIPEEYLQYNY